MSVLLSATLLVPLLLALVPGLRCGGRTLATLLPLAALPALLSAVWLPSGSRLDWPGVLLGLSLELDGIGRVFLLLSALLWLAASLYARDSLRGDPGAKRFSLFWLLAMAGNFGLVLAADAVGFYLFFTLMSFASWPLILHSGRAQARQAGWVYLLMVVLGEGLVLAGMLLAVGAANGVAELALVRVALVDASWQGVTVALLLAGFGVKAGLLGLHVWLPLAHTAAPVAASAVLSGAMIKAGLLGWMRFLPLGETALAAGPWLLGLGLAGALLAVFYGLAQRDSKAVLAYSSVSHMGLLSALVGLALWQPELWAVLSPVLLLYALHHALTKGALFLGVGLVRGGSAMFLLPIMGLLCLSLAGAPLTGGGVAKSALKAALAQQPAWLGWVLTLVAAATALLLGQFMLRLWQERGAAAGSPPAALAGWAVLLPGGLAGGGLAAFWLLDGAPEVALWSLLWPLLLALPLLGALWRYPLPPWPNGDLAAWALAARQWWLRPLRLPLWHLPLWQGWRRGVPLPTGEPLAGVWLGLIGLLLYLAVELW
ncbi:MAG: complex I subunit 5 family protein [Pseudomonadota bacterium]